MEQVVDEVFLPLMRAHAAGAAGGPGAARGV
jgi:hypothetical protein